MEALLQDVIEAAGKSVESDSAIPLAIAEVISSNVNRRARHSRVSETAAK